MKLLQRLFVCLSVAAILILSPSNASAQPISYDEHQLPHPAFLSPFFAGSVTESAIYYGRTPWFSSNKPVIVYVHGFIDLANAWFIFGNDMYASSYYSRHRTAFVAMTRGEGMWRNGEILAEMLEDITDHYNTNDVVIVAHSNGGKASEVAMYHYNKSHLVDRVITLGTPFFGTPLADVAESDPLEWLVDLIGLGGGTSTSTTYYMSGVARPMLDNEPDNEPDKFLNHGTWGWNSGVTLAAPTMWLGGALLNVTGAGPSTGGNDGVTPYYSSTRPGGHEMLPNGYGTWGTKDDHIDITMDYICWDWIKPLFSANMNNLRRAKSELYKQVYEPVESNLQIVSSADEHFYIEEDAIDVNLFVFNEGEEVEVSLVRETASGMRVAAEDVVLERNENYSKNGKTTYSFNTKAMEPGKYSIASTSEKFSAIVTYQNGTALRYYKPLNEARPAYKEGEVIDLSVEIVGAEESALNVNAVVRLKNDLEGNPIANGARYVVDLIDLGNGMYSYELPEGLSAGVYNVMINAEGEQFRKTLVSGFAVQEGAREIEIAATPALSNYPNPIESQTTIQFEILAEGNATLRMYDVYGKLIKEEDLSNFGLGKHETNWKVQHLNLSNGTYYLELHNGLYRNSRTIQVTR